MTRLVAIAMLAARLGCTTDGGEPPTASAQPAFCEPGVRACAPLPGHAVSCEAGFCVARAPGGGVRGDCMGLGTYPDDLANARQCGACGRACAAGAACSAGACLACAVDRSPCAGACRDLANDPGHCGACGRACRPSEQCVAGACLAPCAAEATRCGASCADLRRSRGHCGACEARCGAEEACVDGACVLCPPGLSPCDGACVDLQRDGSNCGACGSACAAASACAAGRCLADCGDDPLTCVGRGACGATFEVSTNNCGACGVACRAGAICDGGRCTPVAPRRIAPLSTAVVTSARPWFRWEPAAGADGVRIEVCADRACDRVERRWDAAGASLRAPDALPAGVHFWRALVRRGGGVAPPDGVVWEFVVPDSPAAPGAPEGARPDLNGDGFADRFALRTGTFFLSDVHPLDVFLGAPSGPSATPSQTFPLRPWGWPSGMAVSDGEREPKYLGDVNGDGYGDVGLIRRERQLDFYMREDWFYYRPVILFGGPRGLRAVEYFVDIRFADRAMPLAQMLYAGDRNGDGYADAGIARSDSGYADLAVFGGAYPWTGVETAPADPSCSTNSPLLHVGDFDADGRSDVAAARCADAPTPLRVYTGRGGMSPSMPNPAPLGGCGLTPRSMDEAGDGVRVADVDVDGYDDLVAWTDAAGAAGVVFRGGPDGLQGDRCQRFP